MGTWPVVDREWTVTRAIEGRGGPRSTGLARRTPAHDVDSSLVEVRLRGTPQSHWVREIAARWDAKVHLHVCRPVGRRPKRILRLIEVVASPKHILEIQSFLRPRCRGGSVTVTSLAPHRLLLWTSEPLPGLCAAVFEAGGVCTTCPFLPSRSTNPEGAWGILIPQRSSANLPLPSFRESGDPPPSVLRVGRFRATSDLTPRQETAIDVAYRLGYFSHPRRVDLGAVARALGVNRSTAMEILRRAMMKLAAHRQGRMMPVGRLA